MGKDKRTRLGELLFWWFLALLCLVLVAGTIYLQAGGGR